MSSQRILICTDLDRTLLPNGPQPESPGARDQFAALVARPEVSVAYVTGRHRSLVEQAIEEFSIPVPDFVIGDVGTSLYHPQAGDWRLDSGWQQRLAASWGGRDRQGIADELGELSGLTLQEPEKQGLFKLSWYTAPDWDRAAGLAQLEARLQAIKVAATLIWSIDESTDTGLLDLLPKAASKRLAIEFLIEQEQFDPARTICSGDSGNDLAMLTSPLPAVLVANATEAVRSEALALAREAGTADSLYLARGGYQGMNGCYAAGILEGVAHFIPDFKLDG